MQGIAWPSASGSAAAIDVVFIAPSPAAGAPEAAVRRTVALAPGAPLPRVGECVIIAFAGPPQRYAVQDVAHVFGAEGHGIAVKLAIPPA